jgi:hypothetical protein
MIISFIEKEKTNPTVSHCTIHRTNLSEILRLSLSAVSISGHDRSKIQARRNDATSHILKHPWRDDEEALLRQHMKGVRMPWKQLFQGFHGRTMAEIKSPLRSLRKLDGDE